MPIAILILNEIKLISAFGMKLFAYFFYCSTFLCVLYEKKNIIKNKNVLENLIFFLKM